MTSAKLFDDPNIRAIEAEISRIREILISKNRDYGSSAFESPYLNPNLSAEDAILVRMSDKINRLHNIMINGNTVSESIEDTVTDLVGYGLIYLANKHKNISEIS